MARKRRTATKRTRRRGTQGRAWLRKLALLAGGAAVAYGVTAFALLDYRARSDFGQTQWRVPAHVYTQPLELYGGRELSPEVLVDHLRGVGYRAVERPDEAGEFSRDGERFVIEARAFRAADGGDPARRLRVRFAGDRVAGVRDGDGEATIARIEPQRMASIFPGRAADRVLVELDEVPERLIDALIAVEDQRFYEHRGVRPLAIARAAWANLRAGRIVQGGSTITQQLAKNFYLSSEQTLGRKFDEALMALSLEWHFSKEEILEAYLNEVYLGQAGSRSINGFGLGARFWFNRPLAELDLHQLALLVGLIRGPTYYDPRAHPERAERRRDVVLERLAAAGVIDADRARRASAQPLDVVPREAVRLTGYPAYADLVRRQLARDYDEEDLRSEGLRVYTHLDPRAQAAAEDAVVARTEAFTDDELQGAAVIAEVNTGAVVAVVGDRAPRTPGFNRALDARRQVGSLAKPAVYLAALRRPDDYTLATPLADEPIEVDRGGGEPWSPRNFDGEYRGTLPLIDALAGSRNAATVDLGMALGLDSVADSLAALEQRERARLRPADLLGAFDRTPLEVTAMYQTIAGDGFHAPLNTIAAVHDADGEALSRDRLDVERVAPTAPVYLLQQALRESVRSGTARALGERWQERGVAGKTGTTNDFRDSWFAGFDGRHVGVAWLGRDDDGPVGLTGSAGGMRVWADMMADLPAASLANDAVPADVEWQRVDVERGATLPADCDRGRRLPFIGDSAPPRASGCGGRQRGLP